MPPLTRPVPRAAGDDALDAWLRRSLHAAHGRIAEEPVPRALLRLASTARAEWDAYPGRWLSGTPSRQDPVEGAPPGPGRVAGS